MTFAAAENSMRALMIVEQTRFRILTPGFGLQQRYAIAASLRYLWDTAGNSASIGKFDSVPAQTKEIADIDLRKKLLWGAWTEKSH
jgi:hypothetical protein